MSVVAENERAEIMTLPGFQRAQCSTQCDDLDRCAIFETVNGGKSHCFPDKYGAFLRDFLAGASNHLGTITFHALYLHLFHYSLLADHPGNVTNPTFWKRSCATLTCQTMTMINGMTSICRRITVSANECNSRLKYYFSEHFWLHG